MIVDSHAHVILPVEKLLRIMDEAGIDRTILFSTSVHPEAAEDINGLEREMNKLNGILSGRYNPVDAKIASMNELVGAVKKYPSRFLGFGTVPLGLPGEETRTWIQEKVVDNGLAGLGEFTLPPGQTSGLEPIFMAASDFGNLPLWIHTFSPLGLGDILAIDKLSRKYPHIPVILGHLGGINWIEAVKIAKENPDLYLDLSGVYTALAPKFAIRELPQRTLFSSDAPYGDPLLARIMVERVSGDPRVAERVLGGNILKLLGR